MTQENTQPEIMYSTPADHVRLITMNRPETLNSLTMDGNQTMLGYVREFRDDSDAWVLILTGAGERSFSTGLDLRRQSQQDASNEEPPPPAQVPNEGLHSYPSIEVFKPVIAAINGYAFGGGSEMALWADIRIMSENAEMGLLEPRRGLLSISGTTRMSRSIPIGLAMELIITGRRYKAARLLSHGPRQPGRPAGGADGHGRRDGDGDRHRVLADGDARRQGAHHAHPAPAHEGGAAGSVPEQQPAADAVPEGHGRGPARLRREAQAPVGRRLVRRTFSA